MNLLSTTLLCIRQYLWEAGRPMTDLFVCQWRKWPYSDISYGSIPQSTLSGQDSQLGTRYVLKQDQGHFMIIRD